MIKEIRRYSDFLIIVGAILSIYTTIAGLLIGILYTIRTVVDSTGNDGEYVMRIVLLYALFIGTLIAVSTRRISILFKFFISFWYIIVLCSAIYNIIHWNMLPHNTILSPLDIPILGYLFRGAFVLIISGMIGKIIVTICNNSIVKKE